jgi:hypothetical protein
LLLFLASQSLSYLLILVKPVVGFDVIDTDYAVSDWPARADVTIGIFLFEFLFYLKKLPEGSFSLFY